uniref:Uncharacterized protein n=1 Tax=uncultured marine virus TaxID=186617 RepID=A0A0F7L5W7_9VIRU|nr:hypothetical protein [uncultured marine virus]
MSLQGLAELVAEFYLERVRDEREGNARVGAERTGSYSEDLGSSQGRRACWEGQDGNR